MRLYNLSSNEAQYHLATLKRHNFIKQYRYGKYLLNYPYNTSLLEEDAKLYLFNTNQNFQNIYNMISSNPFLTINEISEQIGLHRNTIGKYIKIINELNKTKY